MLRHQLRPGCPLLTCTALLMSCGHDARVQRGADAPGGSAQALSDRLAAVVPPMLAEARVPGVAIGVIRDHRVVYQHGFGHAVPGEQPVTASTRFNVGSISKTVTAWAVMRLVEDGRLDLDAPVARYLTRWQLPASEFDATGVTLRRLLSHTAGISRHSVLEVTSADTPSLEQVMSSASADGGVKLVAAPGTKWDYSGGGYSIAQLVIEEVTGKRFADQARATILQPLGMDHSDFELTPAVVADAARCYGTFGEPTRSPRFVEVAAAGLYATLADLTAFAAAATAGPRGEPAGRGVLRPETIDQMVARADGAELGPDHWDGLGYFTDAAPGGRMSRGHSGDNRGWAARFEVIRESGDGLVVMTNGSNGDAVIQQVRCAWLEWLTGERLPGDRCKKQAWLPVLDALERHGRGAVRLALEQVQRNPEYALDVDQLHILGYLLLRQQRIDDAIAVLELNVTAFPRAANPHDLLGEAYLAAGKRDLAIASYRKALEIDPGSKHARKKLDELEHR